MKSDIINKMSRQFHKVGFKLKQHSPEILVVTGIVCGFGATICACKATLKVPDILEDTKEKVDAIHESTSTEVVDPQAEQIVKKELAHVYIHTGAQLAKIYAPAIGLGAISITSILASTNILKERTVALAAAYTTVDGAFKDYRKRVVERFGERVDKELKYNIKTKEIETTIVNEDGTESVVRETVDVYDMDTPSEYARFFDELSPYWEKSPEYNIKFLRDRQEYCNHILRTKGHIYLNEVYSLLGIPTTAAGQVIGWIYDEECPIGDNKVVFYGLDDPKNLNSRAFTNGHEPAILLDFNVDGNILQIAHH